MPASNKLPRYLPHLEHPEILHMGLSPFDAKAWIETDADFEQYRAHKLQQRKLLGDKVYRCTSESLAAQRELAESLLQYLTHEQSAEYALQADTLLYKPAGLTLALAGEEPLWHASLWVADDIVLMQEVDGDYCLTAASLCSPSDWLLEEKFGCPLGAIHAPIPGFTRALSPAVDRFLRHLKAEHPVERFNWSLQAGNDLCRRGNTEEDIGPATALFYRCERQTLTRLHRSGAIAFTIRVYVHPLETLTAVEGAMDALFDAIDATPVSISDYKGFNRLAPALEKYRGNR